MGLWQGRQKEQIIKGFWDQKYYDSANELEKQYYNDELNSLAKFLNAESKEEYEQGCCEYLTAIMRKHYAKSGVLKKHEIDSFSIGKETAQKLIPGGYIEATKVANFYCEFNPVNYNIQSDKYYNNVFKALSPEESEKKNQLNAIRNIRSKDAEFDSFVASCKAQSIDEMVAHYEGKVTGDIINYNNKSSRTKDKVRSIYAHMAKSLKATDNDAFYDEIANVLVEYTNLCNLKKRPDQPDNILYSDNEKIKAEILPKINEYFENKDLRDFKMTLWNDFGDGAISNICRDINLKFTLPSSLINDTKVLDEHELGWYSFDRDYRSKMYSRYLMNDDADSIRNQRSDQLGSIEYDILTAFDKDTALKFATDYAIAQREYARFQIGISHEEETDKKRITYHNKEDYDKIYNALKEEFKDTSLYDLKMEFSKAFIVEPHLKQIQKDLGIQYELPTRAYTKKYPNVFDPTEEWEHVLELEEAERLKEQEAKEANAANDDNQNLEIEDDNAQIEEIEEKEPENEHVSALESQRQDLAKALSEDKLKDFNAKYDSLIAAVSSDNPSDIIEHTSNALALEYPGSLKKSDYLYNTGFDNTEANSKIFQKIIREKYTDEQLLSESFKDKLSDQFRFIKFKKEVDAFKNEVAKNQPEKLKDALRSANVNPDNKFSLQRLSIINSPKALENGSKLSTYQNNISTIAGLRTYPAFGLTKTGVQTKAIFPSMTIADNIEQYCTNVDNFNSNTINGIFKAMANNSLVISSTDGNPENTRFLNMGAKGPFVTKTIKELSEDISAKRNTYLENGFTSFAAMEKAVNTFNKVASLEAKAPEITEKGTQAILSEQKLLANESNLRSTMDNFQIRVSTIRDLKAISMLDDQDNLTKERINAAIPKSPKSNTNDLVDKLFVVENEEPVMEEAAKEEPKAEEVKIEEVKKEEVKAPEIVIDAPKPEEPKPEAIEKAPHIKIVGKPDYSKLSPEELSEKRTAAIRWHNTLKESLRKVGVDPADKFAMGNMVIYDDIPDAEDRIMFDYNDDDISNDEFKQFIAQNDRISHYACMSTDANGNYINPLREGQSKTEWLSENLKPLDALTDEELFYLYDMSQEGRLFLRQNNVQSEGSSELRPVVPNKNGRAIVLDDTYKLKEDFKKNPPVLPVSLADNKELFDRIINYSNNQSIINIKNATRLSFASRYFDNLSGIEEKIRTGQKLTKEETTNRNLYRNEVRNLDLNCNNDLEEKQLCSIFSKHPSWTEDPKTVKTIETTLRYSKINTRYLNPDEVKFLQANPYGRQNAEDIERKLIKNLGVANIEDLMGQKKILDHTGKPIEGKNSFDFASKAMAEMIGANGVYLNYQKDGVNVTEYVSATGSDRYDIVASSYYKDEYSRLLNTLEKVAPKNEKQSDSYKTFINDLKTNKNDLNQLYAQSKYTPFDISNFTFSKIKESANAQLAKFSDPNSITKDNAKYIKTLNRIVALADSNLAYDSIADKRYDKLLAEKIVHETAIDGLNSKNPKTQSEARKLLSNKEYRDKYIQKIQRSEFLRHSIEGKTPAQLDKLLKTDGSKLKAAFTKNYDKIKGTPRDLASKEYHEALYALSDISASVLTGDAKTQLADPSTAMRYALASALVANSQLETANFQNADKTASLAKKLAENDKFKLYVNNLSAKDINGFAKDPKSLFEKHKALINEAVAKKEDAVISDVKYKNSQINNLKKPASYFDAFTLKDGSLDLKDILEGKSDNPVGFSYDRSALQSLAAAHLLNIDKDITLKEMMDPLASYQKRQQAGLEVIQNLKNLSHEEFARFAVDTFKAGINKTTEIIDKTMKAHPDFKLSDFRGNDFIEMKGILSLNMDFGQEMEKAAKFINVINDKDVQKALNRQSVYTTMFTPMTYLDSNMEKFNKIADGYPNKGIGIQAAEFFGSLKYYQDKAHEFASVKDKTFTEVIDELPIVENSRQFLIDETNFRSMLSNEEHGAESEKLGKVLNTKESRLGMVKLVLSDNLPKSFGINTKDITFNGVEELPNAISRARLGLKKVGDFEKAPQNFERNPLYTKINKQFEAKNQEFNRGIYFEGFLKDDGSFDPEKINIAAGKDLDLTITRTGLDSLAAAHLLNTNKDVPIDDLFDPKKSSELMKKAGKEIAEKFATLKKSELAEFVVDSFHQAIMTTSKHCNEYLANNPKISIKDLSGDNHLGLNALLACSQDFKQDLEKADYYVSNNYDKSKLKLSHDHFTAYQNLFMGCTNFDKFARKILTGNDSMPGSNMLNIVGRMIQSNEIVDRASKANPNDVIGEVIKDANAQHGSVDALFNKCFGDAFMLLDTSKDKGGYQMNQLLSNDNKLAFFKTLMTKDIPSELKLNTNEMKFDGFDKLEAMVNQTKAADLAKQQSIETLKNNFENKEKDDIVIDNNNIDGPQAMN